MYIVISCANNKSCISASLHLNYLFFLTSAFVGNSNLILNKSGEREQDNYEKKCFQDFIIKLNNIFVIFL